MELRKFIKHVGEALGDTSQQSLITDWVNQSLIDIALLWPWNFLQRRTTFATVASTNLYSLPVDLLKIVSMTETTNEVHLKPVDINRFDDLEPNPTQTGAPEYYIVFENGGVQNNPSSASALTFSSSDAGYATGTVTVEQGSRRVTGAASVWTTSHDGMPFHIDNDPDDVFFEVDRRVSATTLDLTTIYTRAGAATLAYEMGDLFQRVRIIGTSSGNTIEEVITLNGTTSVVSANSYTAVDSLHISAPNFGRITVTSNAAAVTVATILPRTQRPRYVRVRLFPEPSSTLTINLRYIKRPRELHFFYDQPEYGPEFDKLIIQQALVNGLQWRDDSRISNALSLRDRWLSELLSKENPQSAEVKVFRHMESRGAPRLLKFGSSFPEGFRRGF